jgi:hypothetical protein
MANAKGQRHTASIDRVRRLAHSELLSAQRESTSLDHTVDVQSEFRYQSRISIRSTKTAVNRIAPIARCHDKLHAEVARRTGAVVGAFTERQRARASIGGCES